jgi:Rieske [2Fe-2S] domain
MQLLSRLERDSRLDKAVAAGQRAARLIRPGKVRDGLHGVWLGHPCIRCWSRFRWAPGGELADGCLTCPWHGSVFRLADGSVARGPATAPQPAFLALEVGGAIQVCLPGAG